MTRSARNPVQKAHTEHPRDYRKNRFVYPVLSRRSKGISIGINLNPDKVCNFNCVYCQVDRRSPGASETVIIPGILAELKNILEDVRSEALFRDKRFKDIAREDLRVNDIAFSGDGEPSAFPEILELTRETLSLKNELGFKDVKLIMITNASGLGREESLRAMNLLSHDGGEVWAKLDAGTEHYYQKICRTPVAFDKILKNLLTASQAIPLTIQTCFMNLEGQPPSEEEVSAYCGRLVNIKENHGQIHLVQLYTVARKPAELFVSPLTDKELEMTAEQVRKETGLPVETFV